MTDADFLRWLIDDRRQKTVLAEVRFGYETGGAMTEGTLYLSSTPYVTRPTDTPANRRYHAAIARSAPIAVGINVETLSTQTEISVGSLELDNADGHLDYLLDLVIDGREARIFVGDAEWPRGWFREIFLGVAKRVTQPSADRLVLEVADRRLLLDVTLIGSPISSGPESGRITPLVYGVAYNLSLRNLDGTLNKYAVLDNYTATSYAADVRDAGTSLGATSDAALFSGDNAALTANAGTDTLTFVGHGLSDNDVVLVESTGTVFGGLTAGTRYWVVGVAGNDWQLSSARGGSAVDITGTVFTGTMSFKRFRYMDLLSSSGTLQLSTTPVGQVTADVWERTQGGYSPFELVRTLIETWAPDAEVDTASFTAADVDLRARLDSKYAFCGLAVEERRNLLDVISEILTPFGGWAGPDYDGTVRCGMMAPADIAGETIDHTLGAGALVEHPSFGNLPVLFGGATVGYRRNWTVQADGLATGLTETQRALYSRPDRLQASAGATFDAASASYAGSWWAHHDGAGVVREFRGLHGAESSLPVSIATSEVPRELVADQAPWRRVASARTDLRAYSWRIGEVVQFTYPRAGCDAGVSFRIAGKKLDPTAQTIELTLLAQATPDITTSDYP